MGIVNNNFWIRNFLVPYGLVAWFIAWQLGDCEVFIAERFLKADR